MNKSYSYIYQFYKSLFNEPVFIFLTYFFIFISGTYIYNSDDGKQIYVFP